MLYHLSYWLQGQFSFLNLFRYQTFRSMVAFFLSLAIVLILQPRFIKWFRERALGQPIRDDGPQTHLSKKGTPTMGGLVVVVSVVASTLLLCELWNRFVIVTLLVTLVYGALGFADDYLKIRKKNPKGVSAKTKLAWQIGTAVVALLLLKALGDGMSNEIIFPFTKQGTLDLGWLFIPFATCVIVGASNAVNLTDGLDGLVIGPTMTVAFTYGIFSYVAGNAELSEYLRLPHVLGSGELSIIAGAIIAGGLGFLWYNTFPAQVFMGDVGALALGGALGMFAVITKQELLFVIAGGVFVVEALSVILQVASFKLRGKRIFRMAPIHHHFELLGLSEPKDHRALLDYFDRPRRYLNSVVENSLNREVGMEERVAVITGASRGIGRALALGFAADGYHVVALARSEKELAQLAKEGAGKIVPLTMDVADDSSIADTFAHIRSAFRHIDVLVNNAGAAVSGTLEVPLDSFESLLVVNLTGPFRVLQEVVPMMIEEGRGFIVNVASRAGKVGFPRVGAYGASKFGLVGLGESLYRELGPLGIKVTTLCPSWVDTVMAHDMNTPLPSEEMIDPEDIMRTIRWLLSLSPAACVKEVVMECRADIR